MSSLVQEFLHVAETVRDYRLKVFVETGCENGVSLDVARNLGLRLYTCDVDADKVELCRQTFPDAQISHAKSLDFLADVLPQIRQPALIWLDAHFSPLVDAHEQWPLKEELSMIADMLRTRDQSVILCDDFSTVLQRSLTDFEPTEFQGHPDFADYPMATLTALFPYHHAVVIAENTGVLALYPRARYQELLAKNPAA